MKFAICNEIFKDWEWPRTCRFVKDTGYDGIEIAPFTFADDVRSISRDQRVQIVQIAEDLELPIVGLHWLLVKPEGLYLNHLDPLLRRKTADYLIALTDFCGDLGGSVMVFGSPKQRNVHPDLTFDDAWQYTLETFRLVLPCLAERDVTICFEPLSTAETDFITTAALGRKLVEQIDHPNFRLLLDVKAMSSEEKTIPEIIRENIDVVRHVHVNDPNLSGPGFGDVDFAPILTALKDTHYDGYASVEVFDFTPGPERIAIESLRYLKSF